jgi:phosphoribosylformylglycinamidine cyclo-ligase
MLRGQSPALIAANTIIAAALCIAAIGYTVAARRLLDPYLSALAAGLALLLAGAAVGLVPEGRASILGRDLAPGDDVVLVASSGLHANGASLARMVASQASDGWNTRLGDGRRFGEAILTPSVLYVPLVRALLASDISVRYLSHITGHGLQKLMRPQRDLSYRITDLPPVPIELSYIADATGMSPRDAYGTLNMGAGFAVYAAAGDGARVVDVAQRLGLGARVAGRVEEGPRRVTLEPLGVVFDEHEMSLSAS